MSRPQAVREGSDPLEGCKAAWIAPSGKICTAKEVVEGSDVQTAACVSEGQEAGGSSSELKMSAKCENHTGD